jgi:membrane-associated phospholipid phosphatase
VSSQSGVVLTPSDHRTAKQLLRSTDARRTLRRVLSTIVAFAALAGWCFHRRGPTSLDTTLLHGYRAVRTSFVFRVSDVVTLIGSPGAVVILGVAVAVFVWIRHRSIPWALACIAAPGIAGVAETVLKVIVARPRPGTASLTGEAGNGFPSGHAAGFTAFAFIVAFAFANRHRRRTRQLFICALGTSLTMALTRVLLGAHYPTDVIAGVLGGVVVADVVAFFARNGDEVFAMINAHRSTRET